MNDLIDLLEHIGGFVEDPGVGTVITVCWVFSPLLAFMAVQRIKRVAQRSISDACLEGVALYASWAISMLIMVGLYYVPLRQAFVHSILIAVVYTSSINFWMRWTKKHQPEMYNALRANRRALDDTTEIKGPPI